MEDRSTLLIFIDEEPKPIGEYPAPFHFELDTTRLVDGNHTLKIISKDPGGKEGIRKISFIVRNGPAIAIEGLKENEVVDGTLPLMINAYSKGDQKKFLIEGSETPRSIPSLFWAAIIVFFAWAAYYFIQNLFIS
jgi:hypothetical protein